MKNLLLLSFIFIACSPQDGVNGLNGAPGSSCSVESNLDGAVITCQDGTSSVILNGHTSPYMVKEIIKPCEGTGSKEILLRLYDNQIIAHYSHGVRQYLTFVTPGTWQLTDGSSCIFQVHGDMSVTW